jgi:hypothetical protein
MVLRHFRRFCIKVVQSRPINRDQAKDYTYIYEGSKVILETTQESSISSSIVGTFLPKGYPSTVRKGYDDYVKYQMLASIFATAGGVLSMQSLLYSMGLSATSVEGTGASQEQQKMFQTIPLAATLNWILKDGIGQLGGVIFASTVSTQFDDYPKKWRLISSVTMDTASFIETCLPLFPTYFLPVAAFSNILKNISFLAASASRSAIHKSFALNENLADVTVKAGSQTTLASTIGTAIGIALAALSNNDATTMISLFSACSCIHLLCVYQSLQYVTSNILTPSRLDIILYHYFSDFLRLLHPLGHSSNITTHPTNFNFDPNHQSRSFLTPFDVKQAERLLQIPTLFPTIDLCIGQPISTVVRHESQLKVKYI